MSYVTVFDITHESLPLWIPLFLVIGGMFALIFFLLTRDADCLAKLFFRGFILFLGCVWLTFAILDLRDRRHDIQAYESGRYKVVEGQAEQYSLRGKTECFSVRSVTFCHGTANQVGWEPPLHFVRFSWPVGLVSNGLPVRVAYSDDPIPFERSSSPWILRLDVARNSP